MSLFTLMGVCINCHLPLDRCTCAMRPDRVQAVVGQHPQLETMRERVASGAYGGDTATEDDARLGYLAHLYDTGLIKQG